MRAHALRTRESVCACFTRTSSRYSTLSLALDEIISKGTVKVQKTGEPRSVVFYDGEDGKQHAYISNLSGRALFSHFEKHGFIFI